MCWVMSHGPPLIWVCENQIFFFLISFDGQVTQDPELLSAMPKVTRLVTRKIEIKPRFPDCQT